MSFHGVVIEFRIVIAVDRCVGVIIVVAVEKFAEFHKWENFNYINRLGL